jgi:hypothetical protein
MAYSDFSPARRSRRRRRVVILILLLVVVGVLVLAVRYRTERRESIDYLTAAEEVALEHAEMAEQLGVLFQGLGQEDRPALELRLETFAADAADAVAVLDELVVARPVGEVAGLMTVATESWADGLRALDEAIIAILDAEPNDVTADEQLKVAFELIRLGDRAYLRTLEAIAELDPEIVQAPLPEVTYAGGQFAPLYNPSVVAERLRRQGTLAELVDVALVAITVPEPVSESAGGIRTIPASDELALTVTVSNTGNVVAENITVLVTLQRVGSNEAIEPLSQLIPSIDPDESEIREFPNLSAIPGEVYSITATATVAGSEDSTDDNSFTLVFERNAE